LAGLAYADRDVFPSEPRRAADQKDDFVDRRVRPIHRILLDVV
jgi:hypothetical protein